MNPGLARYFDKKMFVGFATLGLLAATAMSQGPIPEWAAMAELDLRFAGQLRAEGTPDLAVDYLTRVLPIYPAVQQEPLFKPAFP